MSYFVFRSIHILLLAYFFQYVMQNDLRTDTHYMQLVSRQMNLQRKYITFIRHLYSYFAANLKVCSVTAFHNRCQFEIYIVFYFAAADTVTISIEFHTMTIRKDSYLTKWPHTPCTQSFKSNISLKEPYLQSECRFERLISHLSRFLDYYILVDSIFWHYFNRRSIQCTCKNTKN